MQIYLGSLYVTSFNEFGRYWQVTLQAEGSYRYRESDINLLEVRNKWGEMVPLGTLVTMREIGGPVMVHALQPVRRRSDHRATSGRRFQLRAGHRRHRRARPSRHCRARWRRSGPN